MAAGEPALALLATPLNFHLLRALQDEPIELADLRRALGTPPESTMRLCLRTLEDVEVIERHRKSAFPSSTKCELTLAGQKLMRVAEVLQQWLRAAPDGPISLGSPAAKSAVKALLGGWSSQALRALAAKPLKLTDLHRLVPHISYPQLERRLRAMHDVGQLKRSTKESGGGTPYKVTHWLRRAVVPLSSAIAWEDTYVPTAAAEITRTDVETLFLLSVPLLELPEATSGRCRLAVEIAHDSNRKFAGISISVEAGRLVSGSVRRGTEVDAVATGNPLGWVKWIARDDAKEMELEGDIGLLFAVAAGLRRAFTL